MSVIGSNILAGASGQGGDYTIARSLRFRSSASAYLNRTPASSPTSNQKGTFSFWFKRGSLATGTEQWIFSAGSNSLGCYIPVANYLAFEYFGGSYLVTTQVLRDPSAWYHVVLAIDTTQATASNRAKLYINGNQVTSFGTEQYPSQNATFNWMGNGQACYINQIYSTGRYFDGYMAEWNYIDGQQLTPSSFGATNASTGVWQPKKYAGTYGTNGFYLPFTDNSGATSTTIGKDFSGNSNNWTPNNISVTAGATYDSMTDVPTLTSATAANYCVMNPLQSGLTLAGANLNASGSDRTSLGSIYISSGKWYFEATLVSSTSAGDGVGIAQSDVALVLGGVYSTGTFNIYQKDGSKRTAAGAVSYGASYTTNDVIGVAFDADAGTLTFYKNNVSQGTAFTGLTGLYAAHIFSPGTSSWSVNFGQRPFAYTPPTGFKALNTFNLPTPTIGATASTQANKYMDVTTYTGNGVARSITNSGSMQPDLVWAKCRSTTYDHGLYDSVRGVQKVLLSNSTSAEITVTDGLSAFNSNGFSFSGGNGTVNVNNETYVAWQWKGGNGTVSNTAGSITSTVSANTSAGFSVVTYTGTGANATVGHGLGVAPSMVIVKSRTNGAMQWHIWHKAFTGLQYLFFNTDSVQSASNAWNSTVPTSTVFSLGSGLGTNQSSGNYVAYCFSQIAGYSAFGSYTGNGSSDGTFIATGFKPKYVMMKRTDSTGDWQIFDASRSPFNVASNALYANGSFAEDSNVTNRSVDFLSNGFKIRSSGTFINASGGTFIYMAFAETPFKYSLAD